MKTWITIFLALLVQVLALQWWNDAYRSDIGGDPDEPAHAVTALMVRDYIATSLGQHPLRFAQAYYDRLPKVALGHYPPMFYAVAGVWLLPFASAKALIALQAVLIALLGTLTAWCGAQFMSRWMGILAGLLLCWCSPMEKIAVLVMSDVLLAVACLCSAIAFASFIERPRASAALGFGLAAALAILIKGSGWMLAVLPPIAVAITGQWRLLLKPSLWLAPLPVIVLALPWQLFSLHFTQEGMSGLTPSQHFMQAIPFYGEAAWANFGPVVLLLLLTSVVVIARQHPRNPLVASLAALFLASLVLMFTVPAGFSSRYFVPMIAPIMLLVCLALPRPWVLGLVVASLLWAKHDKVYHKDVHGFTDIVQHTTSNAQHGTWLVCSDSRGEGGIIAAAAFDPSIRTQKDFSVLRATKELADTDWVSHHYELLFKDDASLLQHLKDKRVTAIFFDEGVTAEFHQPHFDQLKHALTQPSSGWAQSKKWSVSHGETGHGEMQLYVPQTP